MTFEKHIPWCNADTYAQGQQNSLKDLPPLYDLRQCQAVPWPARGPKQGEIEQSIKRV